MRILIADDDKMFRLLLRSSVRDWDCRVVEVTDGQVAWDTLSTQQGPWLTVLDWQMPGLDGPEVCQRIRQLPDSQLIYAILVTARNARADRVAGLRSGADDYVAKPFDRDEMVARLQIGARVLRLQQKLADQVRDLEEALTQVKTLHGLLPICSYCKSVRTDEDYWQHLEHYLTEHSDLQLSHGICPNCYQNVIQPQLDARKRSAGLPGSRE